MRQVRVKCCCISGGLNTSSLDFLQNLDSLKESVRLAGTGGYDWQNIDITQFQGNNKDIDTCIAQFQK